MPARTKVCNECASEKPLEDFSPDSQNSDGRRGKCKACFAAAVRSRRRANGGPRVDLWVERPRLAEMGLRRCLECKEARPLSEFYADAGAPDGLYTRCKPCVQATRPVNDRARHLWNEHRLTADEFDALLNEQGGACAICRTTTPGGKGDAWHIDHDHACCPQRYSCAACRRGILCHYCNTALSSMEKDPWGWALSACQYLLGSPSIAEHQPAGFILTDAQRWKLWTIYRLRPPGFWSILESQGWGCGICGSFSDSREGWHIDHSHACCPGVRSCGECIRGALCMSCNRSLGLFREDAGLIKEAANYLARWAVR